MRPGAELLRTWLKDRDEPPEVAILGWDDSDYSSLLAQAEEWAGKLAAEDRPAVVVHLTGGTKPMSMALQRAFGKRGESFAGRLSGPYVDTAHQRIEDLLAQPPTERPMQSVVNIRDLLRVQGFDAANPMSSNPNYRQWWQRDRLFKVLLNPKTNRFLSSWYGVLNGVESAIQQRKKSNQESFARAIFVGDGSSKKFRIEISAQGKRWEELRSALQGAFGNALAASGAATFTFESGASTVFDLTLGNTEMDELQFLKGVWLEVWLARHFDEADVDDWVQGLEIQRLETPNEWDLLVANGNRFLAIEVKTSNERNPGVDNSNTKAAETLYKLDSKAEKLGRYFNDRWLVSLRALAPEDRTRAKNLGIRVIDGDQLLRIRQIIREWVDNTRLDRAQSFQPAFSGAAPQAAKRGR